VVVFRQNSQTTMTIDQDLQNRLETIFAALNKKSAQKGFPPPLELSKKLEEIAPSKTASCTTKFVSQEVSTLFATAAIDIWLRSVHSFLISASLSETSPIWASVSGYYSSHYSVRALAHLLGFFQLYKKKQIAQLSISSKGKYICTFDPKSAGDREHRFYWKIVKQNAHFRSDDFFKENDGEVDRSDVGHRDRANYADHLGQLQRFVPLKREMIEQRIQFISEMQLTAPPIPRKSKFPDVDSVQVIAYHRLVKFRRFLDEVLGGSNRFWSVHRSPTWTDGILDFQLTSPADLSSFSN
jgi:hypothetical protein